MCVNLVLNGIFVFVFNWGSVSVALATSFSAFANLLFLIVGMKEQFPLNKFKEFAYESGKTVGVSLLALLSASLLAKEVISQSYFWEVILGKDMVLVRVFSRQLVEFIFPASIFLLALVGFAFMFKVKSITCWCKDVYKIDV